jgi:hypothetical protein
MLRAPRAALLGPSPGCWPSVSLVYLWHVFLGIKINFVATWSPITAQGGYLFDYGIGEATIYLTTFL